MFDAAGDELVTVKFNAVVPPAHPVLPSATEAVVAMESVGAAVQGVAADAVFLGVGVLVAKSAVFESESVHPSAARRALSETEPAGAVAAPSK